MNHKKITAKQFNFTKWRLLWILIAAAWLFVILKVLVGALFEKNTSLVAAFSVTNPAKISATVEITAKCPGVELTEKEKRKMMKGVADAIGLTLDMEPEVTQTSKRQEIAFFKDAVAADTEIKVISLLLPEEEQQGEAVEKNYLYAKIDLRESLDSVLAYKQLLEAAMTELSCTEISTTLQLVGDYAGYLPVERRDEISEKILKALGAEVVYEYRENDLYTIYAYTAGLDNYITVDGKKINLHIAMSRNEEHYRTILYLASPILPDTW